MKPKVFYDKSTKRLKKILGRYIPHNTRLRPIGICQIDLNDNTSCADSEVTVHSIYPNLTTPLEISEHLYKACSDYWKPKRSVTTDYVVVEVPNGRIYTDNESSVAIVTQENRLVENVSLSMIDGKVVSPEQNNIFEQSYFQVPTRFKGTVFSLLTGGAGLNNIGHWFMDVLPRLHLLRESGLYDEVDWFLVPSTRYGYQTETLELLGIPSEKIITGAEYHHLTADRIIASTAPRGNHTLVPRWLGQFIRDSFLPLVQEEEMAVSETAPNLYISRSDSAIRNVLNEKELLEALETYKFKSVISSKYSILEKIKMFSQAKVVVSATGAGLISMFFCKPGTKIIEIFHEGFVIEPFYDIATKIDLDYDYIICKGDKPVHDAAEGQRQHLFVETDQVVEILEKMRKSSGVKSSVETV
ncbi:glycosyltransferase family 61 protein [Pontibacter sp. JH31]|uniref:Glycosyltransferase family 61 protein n=1 Tax=Pontibacter aquaedesilientis TaxID=2766980 RepID=A0ABR7XBF6_9BACT|nr:glycosyltransferase family 61 protein [Pontibacter aquaedesilientis]MBD1395617.1 glycosyltransferase family 61 protein [Pontibacter aquaedesilientis]